MQIDATRFTCLVKVAAFFLSSFASAFSIYLSFDIFINYLFTMSAMQCNAMKGKKIVCFLNVQLVMDGVGSEK